MSLGIFLLFLAMFLTCAPTLRKNWFYAKSLAFFPLYYKSHSFLIKKANKVSSINVG